jgi:mono/diheme cytochrome c family protein
MEDGKGLQGIIPPLAGADYLSGSRSELACIIRYGQKGEIVVNGKSYNQIMTGIPELNEVEIANVLNYVFNEWGNKEPFISPDEVKIQLENCEREEL